MKLWRECLAVCGVLAACSDNGTGPSGSGQGHIVYSLPNGDQFRIAARAGATPQNVSAVLDALSPGSDEWISTSWDGEWLLLSTERFDPDCSGFACLAIVKGDLSSGEVIQVNGNALHATGSGTVAAGGNVVVYQDLGVGTNTRDLWVTTRLGGTWSAPVALTGASPFLFNSHPSFSADGSRIVFDCGNEPFGAQGTSICEVSITGSGFRIAARPADSPPGLTDIAALHHPAYSPDGGLVFEANWAGEQIWKLSPGSPTPVPLSSALTNDNSPCVLPDGRIASLWLSRAGNPQGLHEIKVMTPSGGEYLMALTLVDVADVGISCGN
ncbi:MAG: TolB family protein [Gemmatimonadaceae bacterium]